MPELPVAERIDSMIEVDQVITEADAKHESNRCLNCCRICYDPDRTTAATRGASADLVAGLPGSFRQTPPPACFLSPRLPYTGSPMTGCPMLLQCTRI
jgi:hypothetical protein